jgi:hypothetical protein
MLILAHDYLLVILLWSFYEDSLLFASLGILIVYNCSKICLYALWNTIILDLMYSISFFSRFVFDKIIVKGGEYEHKVDWTLANQVIERGNMINIYLRERELALRVLGGVDSGVVFEFELFFTLLCHFGLFYRFLCLLLILRHFLLDDLLEFSWLLVF